MGKLYVIATPIGNLSDITFRAIETLKSVDLILAEDTRKSSILLKHYNIDIPTYSYRDQNHLRVVDKILTSLKNNLNIALISDSGTPLISDPGYKLVELLKDQEIEVIPIPGPSAVTTALSVSGLPTDKFVFLGFLPKSSKKIQDLLEKYGNLDSTLIIHESPHRLNKLIKLIENTLGNRNVFIGTEMTKKFESYKKTTVKKFLKDYLNKKWKGEVTLLIAKSKSV